MDQNSQNAKDWNNDIRASYTIKKAYNAKLDLQDIAQKMADGISIGTTQVAEGIYTPKTSATHIHTTGFIPGRLRADVVEYHPSEEDPNRAEMTVAFSSEILSDIGGFPMLTSALIGDQYGTAYEIDEGRLVNLELPSEYLKQYNGPKFGLSGLRDLYGTDDALSAVLLKPNTGQPPEHYAIIAEQAAKGGANYIKDDEMKVNTPEMVSKISQTLKKVEDQQGRKIIYGPNVTSSYKNAKDQALMAIKNGASAIMINVVHGGLEYVRRLSEDNDITVPIHIHRTGHDAMTRGKFGLNLKVFTQLWRLAGADQIHIGPVFGGLYKPSEIKDIHSINNLELGHVKKSLSVVSRGNLNVIPGTMSFLQSKDLLFLCDDGVYKHPEGVESGMKEVSSLLKSIDNPGELSEKDSKDIDYNNENVHFE